MNFPFRSIPRFWGGLLLAVQVAAPATVAQAAALSINGLASAHQRSAVNTNAKRLLLGHAFDGLGAIRVELKTDALNQKSRAAIGRIGAVQEGIFRKHLITASGRLRDGNLHFKSSTNRAPRQCTPGVEGERRELQLELKVLADVGLLGDRKSVV